MAEARLARDAEYILPYGDDFIFSLLLELIPMLSCDFEPRRGGFFAS